MNIFILDGTRMTDRETAHSYLAHVLRLPDYYGNNLDALYDCLSEFSDDTTIILMNEKAVKENLGDYGRALIKVFTAAADEEMSFHLIHQN